LKAGSAVLALALDCDPKVQATLIEMSNEYIDLMNAARQDNASHPLASPKITRNEPAN
jgi:hypothetical protein